MKRMIIASTASDMMNYPLAQAISKACSKYGYVAHRVYVRWDALTVQVYAQDRGSYHPEIYIDDDFTGAGTTIKIQTTAYGSISLDEYPDFLNACEDAYNLCSEISDAINRIGTDESAVYHAD